MEVCTHKRKIKKLQILKQECRSAKKLARLLFDFTSSTQWTTIVNRYERHTPFTTVDHASGDMTVMLGLQQL